MSSYVSSNWRGTSQPPDNGPRAKCDQVVFEAIAKAAEIIVAARGGASENSPGSSNGSRFNLQVPEIAGVRSILQGSRRALHVPLRLDVYYQHNDEKGERRELLERWCLEYVPCRIETFLEREGHLTQDPIAQLRHVCKRVVIWLRTLYCWSRLLPAQAFRSANSNSNYNPIGFSLYVSDGSDDVNDLVANQGFRSQQQPASVVTPYGELGWRAIYVDKTVVERLLPQGHATKSPLWAPRVSTAARPIPIQKGSTGSVHSTNAINSDRRIVPQTAPAHMVDAEWHKPEKRQQFPQQSYDPSHFQRRSQSTIDSHGHAPDLHRRHTTLGDEIDPSSMTNGSGSSDKPPERVMSGLSLALMMSDERGEQGRHTQGLDPAATEKRRAALHQMPPHLVEHQIVSSPGTSRKMQRPSGQGEYGYAYNNHIPWQKIHPSSTNATLGRSPGDAYDGRMLSTSPSALVSTPPSGACFLGPGTTPPVSSGQLIPPRSSMTPPFAPRPTGFAQEPPMQFLSPTVEHPEQAQRLRPQNPIPPLSSLDLLHSSPFQQPQQGSFVSSFSLAPPVGTDSAVMMNSGDLRRSLWSATAGSAIVPSSTQDEDFEEMPFAVDISSASHAEVNMNSSQLGASATVASFAQKCAPSNRLKMFESGMESLQERQQQQHPDDMVSSLADQLAEFRSFGASLHISINGTASEHDQGSSSSAAISLRTS